MRIAIDKISDIWHSVDWAWRARGEIRELDPCVGSSPLPKMNEVCLYRQADVRVVWVFDRYNMSCKQGFGSIIENQVQGAQVIAIDVKWEVFGSFPQSSVPEGSAIRGEGSEVGRSKQKLGDGLFYFCHR